MPTESAALDRLDEQIIRVVQLSPRIPFRVAAQVLGVSEQTVARRYRRLHRSGVIRVTALLRPAALGQHNWMVRLQVRPSGADSLARALAQRDDVSWVTVVSGGAELVCVLRARSSESRDDLLMQRLPRTAPVLGMSAAMVMHRFVGVGTGLNDDWIELADVLTPEQTAAVAATAQEAPVDDRGPVELRPEDYALIDELARDGRAPMSRLAQAAGMSESRAARRLAALIEQGAAYLDLDLSTAALGLHTTASLFLQVEPGALDSAGRAVAAQREIPFAAAITGAQNLTASVVCRDVEHLYRFVTGSVGAIPGVRGVEVLPVLRQIKQSGAVTDGDRLAVS
ncbi:Lrp/AsnC family transcriptional regulator [Jatrophihabitans fulvus]